MNIEKFIPVDKSHCIRATLIDLFQHNIDSTHKFNTEIISDDLVALNFAVKDWLSNSPTIFVGESGTLFRFFQYAIWKRNLNKTLIRCGTLKNRNICTDSSIVKLPQGELLRLDNGTSQWASAAVLLGDTERLPKSPAKLRLTYDVMDNWDKKWEPDTDMTILHQAMCCHAILQNNVNKFEPKHSEDYCFAYAIGKITKEEGLIRWPSLLSHESNRIEEMEYQLQRVKDNLIVMSKDHRVVQALAMWGLINNYPVTFESSEVVFKSWPLFWNFIHFLK
jgi:hypothetical protein